MIFIPYKLLFASFLSVVFFVSTQAQNPHAIDSLLNFLKNAREDTTKVNTLNELAVELVNINPDTSIILANQALSLSEKAKSRKHIANSYHTMARAYSLKGNYPASLEYNFKALALREELGDKSGIAKSLGNIGTGYMEQANYPKALDYYFRTLKMDEEVADKLGIAISLGNIGIVYSDLGDYPKALDYYLKALKIEEDIGDKEGIAIVHFNIAVVYHKQNDYPKALDYYSRALKMAEQLGNLNGILGLLGNIGLVYYKQGDYPKALDYYSRALKMSEQLGITSGIGFWLGNIGVVYSETGKFVEAEEYLKKAIAINDSIGALEELWQFEEALSQLYENTGRYKLALVHYKKTQVLKDTLYNQEKNKEITRKEMNYEFAKKEEAIKAEQDKKDAVMQQQIQKQRILKYAFMGALGFTLLLSFFIYNNYTTSQKLKLENIRNNIAADLHDDIGSTLNSISLFSEVAKQEAGKPIPALDHIGVSARKIIDAMSDIVWTINPENDTFENVIVRMRSLAYLLLKAKAIEFTFKADENINRLSLPIPVRKNFYLLFKEALNNLVKYSNATRASFQISLDNKIVKMVIRDNGVGFDTVSAPGEGNGIKNMKRRAAEIGAQLVIESTEGKGTNIELSLKL